MAGTFAHFLAVEQLCRDNEQLDTIASLTPAMKRALMTQTHFCRLGAISPDLPYLSVASSEAECWGNLFHHWNTAQIVRDAIPLVYKMNYGTKDAQRCIAWLFGYVAHLVADLTVHPVVNTCVGPYAQNKAAHRECEMHQDSAIFRQINREEIVTCPNLIEQTGLIACARDSAGKKLHAEVKAMLEHCLLKMPRHGQILENGKKAPSCKPDIDGWFKAYISMMRLASRGRENNLWLTRLIDSATPILYPSSAKLKAKYIERLACPDGKHRDYARLFKRVVRNIATVWQSLGDALDSGDPARFLLANGNLDSGLKDNTSEMMFWRNKK